MVLSVKPGKRTVSQNVFRSRGVEEHGVLRRKPSCGNTYDFNYYVTRCGEAGLWTTIIFAFVSPRQSGSIFVWLCIVEMSK